MNRIIFKLYTTIPHVAYKTNPKLNLVFRIYIIIKYIRNDSDIIKNTCVI